MIRVAATPWWWLTLRAETPQPLTPLVSAKPGHSPPFGTRHSEVMHLLGVAATSFAMGALAVSSNGTPTRFTLLGLVMAANLYPVLLQRATRARIHRCLNRIGARKAGN